MPSLGAAAGNGRGTELPGLFIERGGGAGLALAERGGGGGRIDPSEAMLCKLGLTGIGDRAVGVTGREALGVGDPAMGNGGTGGMAEEECGWGVREREVGVGVEALDEKESGVGVEALDEEDSDIEGGWEWWNGGGDDLSLGFSTRSASNRKRKSSPYSWRSW
ncbi:hypothetical protein SERLADRAFT_432867 [Serpula lacrymans var. lacrymans S7.9]|uniref:Uncharacterized protein n=1 Tax=Serpula lacrymans var. lacrymans (strain S7.9) TaxID=578457 RepID=F8NFD6_SERL9|nr:uncharacterized protein SERLADRAFT_432867 [Serpula lacrymans var. lacrymans S7.9]EGO31219.1 hypothetical protein SERLADRAFT_432867 [Serpula lacrymans var. lacrymans S7.9]